MQLELAPYLNRIIAPPLRPVNSQVIRPAEKVLLSWLASIMSTLELRGQVELQPQLMNLKAASRRGWRDCLTC